MKSYAAWIIAAALCAGAVAQTQAQEAAKADQTKRHAMPTPEEMFKKMDTNGDGQLSLDEYKAAMTERAKKSGKDMPADMIEKKFKAMDTDNSGSLSLDEFKKGRDMGHGRHGADAAKTPAAAPAAPVAPVAPAAAPAAQ